MKWIGLTGGIATGKSTVSRMLRAQGFTVVDADELAREVVRPGSDGYLEVIAAFGPDAALPDGGLDRKKIGAIVFAAPAKRAVLEGIIHPRVRALAAERRAEIESTGAALAFYDVPLLFEKKMQDQFDLTVAVVCSPEIQLKRLVKRDGLSEDEALRRLQAQLPIGEKARLSDEVVRNDAGIPELEAAVEDLLRRLHHAQT